jgi:Trypsin-like peptidase domain/Trypsin
LVRSSTPFPSVVSEDVGLVAIMKLAAITGAGIALLSAFPAGALVGGAPQASQNIARHVVMVVGSDNTYCSGVVIAQDLILTAAQCIHPDTRYKIVGLDPPRVLTSVSHVIVHPEWDSKAYLKRRVSADVGLLKLVAPLPRTYKSIALADTAPTAGSQAIVAGYGVAKDGDRKTGGVLRAARFVVTGNPSQIQMRLVDPNTRGELAGLGACMGDSGGPVFDTRDDGLVVLGMVSWATGPALSIGCGGLTGATPIVRYRGWVIKTAAAMGSALSPMAPQEPSEASPKPAQTVIRLPGWTGERPPMPVNYAAQDLSAQEIFRTVAPSVYLIVAGRTREANIGSAVAVAADTALTNCHVIENQASIMVLDEATKQPLKANVSSADRSSDRCFLKVDGGSLNPIAAVRRFKDLSVGERVYTIGNPSGLSKTLGEGLISGLRQHDGVRYVQTTAQISGGSSGGALVDSKGALVGITTFLLKDGQNLNFAIAAEEYWR